MEKFFKASISKTMMSAGLAFSLLLLGIGGMLLALGITAWNGGDRAAVIPILGGLMSLLIWGICLLFIPHGYQLTTTALIVRRWGPKVVIPLGEIRELRRITLSKVLRTCGVGGMFGCWGQFTTYDNTLGFHDFTAYLTRNDTEVVIFRKKGEPVVLSPDQPETFIAAVMERIGPKGNS